MEIEIFSKAEDILRKKSNLGILIVPEFKIVWCFPKEQTQTGHAHIYF